MDDVRAEKARLRRATLAAVRQIPIDSRRQLDSLVLSRLCELSSYHSSDCPLLYLGALPEEIATRPAVDLRFSEGRRVVLPRIVRDEQRLALHAVGDPNDLVSGYRGILEPAGDLAEIDPTRVDFVLVPGVAFDRAGRRIGRGGGYYDRLLPQLRPDVARVVVAYDEQVVEQIPTEAHDQAVDLIVTPSRLISTGARGLAL